VTVSVVRAVRSVSLAFFDFLEGVEASTATGEEATGRGRTKIWERVWRARVGAAFEVEERREREMMGVGRGMVDLSLGS